VHEAKLSDRLRIHGLVSFPQLLTGPLLLLGPDAIRFEATNRMAAEPSFTRRLQDVADVARLA